MRLTVFPAHGRLAGVDGVGAVPSGKSPALVYTEKLSTGWASVSTRARHMLPVSSWKLIWSVDAPLSVTPRIVGDAPGVALTCCRVCGVGSHATLGNVVGNAPVLIVSLVGSQSCRCKANPAVRDGENAATTGSPIAPTARVPPTAVSATRPAARSRASPEGATALGGRPTAAPPCCMTCTNSCAISLRPSAVPARIAPRRKPHDDRPCRRAPPRLSPTRWPADRYAPARDRNHTPCALP